MLELINLTKRFGGLTAIRDLSFSVPEGSFLGVIGPNGAGKTTLLNLITGYLRPTSGSIRFEDRPITSLQAFAISKLGVGRTFQVVRPFAEMSVLDNVMTGALFSSNRHVSMREARAACEQPLELVGLAHRRDVLAGTLTLGEKKKLELARALATRPRLLLLDEVLGGLPHRDVEDLMTVLQRIHHAGTSILMIEHLVWVILELCHRVVVLNFGEKILDDRPDVVVSDARVIESYLGKPIEHERKVAAV